jgi:hypothetical protein
MKVKEMKRKETDYQKREKEMKYKEPRQARIGNKKTSANPRHQTRDPRKEICDNCRTPKAHLTPGKHIPQKGGRH